MELNISDSAYRKIENNQTKLSLEKFLQIAKILDVSINNLFGEKSHKEYYQYNQLSDKHIEFRLSQPAV